MASGVVISVCQCRGTLSVLAAAAAAPALQVDFWWARVDCTCPRALHLVCQWLRQAASGKLRPRGSFCPLLALGPSPHHLLDPSLFPCFCIFLCQEEGPRRPTTGRTSSFLASFSSSASTQPPSSRASPPLRSFGTARLGGRVLPTCGLLFTSPQSYPYTRTVHRTSASRVEIRVSHF